MLQCQHKNDINYESAIRIDTLYISQTITDTIPRLVTKTIKEVRIDTLFSIDSIPTPIFLPLEQLKYQNEVVTDLQDTIQYSAYIEGYKARLDSININMRYKQYNMLINSNKNNKGWKDKLNLGIQVGCGCGLISNKPDIYVGIGLSYNFNL